MKNRMKAIALAAMGLGLFASSHAEAAVVLVNNDIATSTVWTSGNVYRLQKQIYVLPGATLIIQPGTVIASTTGVNGSLAVTRGAQIFVNGTQQNPVIMTSTSDVATWAPLASHPTGKNPKTGAWREAANEWGNLTIMGRAYISENAVAGNTPAPNANNVAQMEGLVAAFPGDPNVLYGGGLDNDDSGSIRFLSLRYGGRVIGLTNELNGLSLGGIGRETVLSHVEVMNNVDDGIEIWGGTVNMKYFTVWNIGDDSIDIDQGWRGKMQFGLIVQGYSLDASQGSGVGDNIFELDGAEQSDYQPVTTGVIYNVTSIGQPVSGAGDHGTAWRDNARVQLRNCIFMDLGDQLIRNDNVDGDGGLGYGHNGTLTWAQTWNTNFNVFSTVNAPPNPAVFYQAQTSGKLIEMKDSVFWRNLAPAAYTESDLRGVTVAGGSAPANNNIVSVYNPGNPTLNQPIVTLNRAAPVTKGGTTQVRVTGIDPRAANAAVASAAAAPNDGFFTPAMYRGGFSSTLNWLCTWTAADAFGMVIKPAGTCETFTPTGACCLPSGVCSPDTTQAACASANGVYQGQWSECTGQCPQPTGACCLQNGTCSPNVTQANCVAAGGTYQGNNTACTGQCAQPVGACCLNDGSCNSNVAETSCVAAGGVYQGNNSVCSGQCPQPTGACCLLDGSCEAALTQAQCLASNGTYQGNNSLCSGQCPQPTGACCLPGEVCTIVTEATCVADGGTFQGVDIQCIGQCETPCPADVSGDKVVNANDLLMVINSWGACPDCTEGCDADTNGDCLINANDLLNVINSWGACSK